MNEPSNPSPGGTPDAQLWQLWRRGQRVDVSEFLSGFARLETTDLVAVLLIDQSERWQLGERIPAENYLRRFPALEADTEAVVELAYGEYLLREERGDRPILEEYLWRFPEHQKRLRQQVELHRAVQGDSVAGQAASSLAASVQQTTPVQTAAEVSGLPRVPGYEIVEVLGRGGMGVVYKARQMGLNRLCALKMILAGEHAGAADLVRFRSEAEAIARLQHPNIVAVYEVGEHDGKPFFSLEFCPGGSLDRKLAGTPLDPREAARLVETLAGAVQEAHQANVIHRDLKPANVLLSGSIGCQPVTGSQAGSLCYVPKISDFGLAKKLDASAAQTHSGAIVGTPSYMSPEQAAGKSKEVGPASDVYALGAILYECLTGRPPFRAATALDTLRQVLSDEPVSPTQLQSRTPRDLETIALKCLHKDPARRYGSAQELADDLGRFLRGEPIRARRVGRLERTGKWVRRNPVLAGLLAAVVLAVVGGGWAVWERAERGSEAERTVSLALGKAEQLREQARQMPARTSQEADRALAVWQQVEAALGPAEAGLDSGPVSSGLRQRVQEVREQVDQERGEVAARRAQAVRKEKLLRDLDEARLARSTWIRGRFDYQGASAKYAEAFAAHGLEVKRGQAAELARRIRDSEPEVREALIVALGDWTLCTVGARTEWLAKELWKIAQAADDDPWRKKFRLALVGEDRAGLRALAKEARQLRLPPSSIHLLAEYLNRPAERDEALALLRWARGRHPTDFWIPFELAQVLRARREQTPVVLEEAIGCFRVALALRPDTTAVLNNLGLAFQDRKDPDEAIACFRKVIAIDPRHANAHLNLGQAMQGRGKLDEAIACYRRALAVAPGFIFAHNNLGTALAEKGKVEEAIASYRKAMDLDARFAPAHYNMGNALERRGKVDKAIAWFRKAIDLDPRYGIAHYNLGRLLLSRGKEDEAVAHYRQAIDCEPGLAIAYHALGLVLNARGKVDEAVACFRKAIEIDATNAKAHSELGTISRNRGKAAEAIALYRKAIALDPKLATLHYNLGLALWAEGKKDEAIDCYRRAIVLDPKFAQAQSSLGGALYEKGQLDEAIACHQRAIDLDPRSAPAQHALGVALAARGKVDEAIAAYRRAIEIDPRHAQAWIALGDAHKTTRKADEAIPCYRKAIEIDPRLPLAYNNLGNSLADRGKVEEAIACYHKALDIDPKYALAHHNLGNALANRGKAEEAIACFKRAVAIDPRLAHAYGALGQILMQQGRFTESKESLRRCLDLLPANHPLRGGAALQLRQCQQWLDVENKLKAFLAGKAVPDDPAFVIQMAVAAQLPANQFRLTAARLYRDALARAPQFAPAYRYHAASCAALAAAGQGRDAGGLDSSQRLGWRRQALTWLRAELLLRTRQVQVRPADRAAMQQFLRRWQSDPNLASLRDREALARLSLEERQACQKLWDDVAELLNRSDGR
jgi:serine/threonine-protein kinase